MKFSVSVDISFESKPKGFGSIRSTFKIWISKDIRSGHSWNHLFESEAGLFEPKSFLERFAFLSSELFLIVVFLEHNVDT